MEKRPPKKKIHELELHESGRRHIGHRENFAMAAAAAAAAARDEPSVVVDRAGPAAARRHRTGIPLRCVNCLVHHHGLL